MLFVKCLLGIIWVPVGICFDECVEDDEEFSHTGDEDDLERFALVFESLGEAADDRIATPCGEGGHVRHAADRGSSSPDGAFAMKAPAVSIEGGQTDQGGDFLPVERAEFREFGQQRNGGAF